MGKWLAKAGESLRLLPFMLGSFFAVGLNLVVLGNSLEGAFVGFLSASVGALSLKGWGVYVRRTTPAQIPVDPELEAIERGLDLELGLGSSVEEEFSLLEAREARALERATREKAQWEQELRALVKDYNLWQQKKTRVFKQYRKMNW